MITSTGSKQFVLFNKKYSGKSGFPLSVSQNWETHAVSKFYTRNLLKAA